jgi:hypothetical protein
MLYIPVLLSAALVEELELKTKTDHTPPTTHSNQFQLFHDSSRQQYRYVHYSLFYRTYCIFRRIYIFNNNCNFNLIYRYSLSVNWILSITVLRLPDAAVTVVCAPEDGCWWRPKHVEQLPDKINSLKCASSWDLYISFFYGTAEISEESSSSG